MNLLDAQKRAIGWDDDSSHALGLTHSATHGESLDGHGRVVTKLPPPPDGYRADLAGKTPDELLAALDTERGDPNSVDDRTLQPEITIALGGGSKVKMRKKERKMNVAEINEKRDRSMQDDGRPKESELDRANRLHEENLAKIDAAPGPGRPLKGKERRMRVSTRIEPSTAIDLLSTGKSFNEILEGVQELLSLTRTGADASALLNAVADLCQERPL